MVVRLEGEPTAVAVYRAISATIAVAMDVAYSRATKPDSHPIIPHEGTIEWLALRTVSDLLELGYEPDGWETAYGDRDASSYREPWLRERGR